jgi:hypothetical protein
MSPHSKNTIDSAESQSARRSDAGQIRLQPRDVDGLLFTAAMYAVPYDLLAARLGVNEARFRAVVARWRAAGLVATGSLSEGLPWCWLTPAGMRHTGYPWEADRPPLGRLAHLRAAVAVRLWMEGDRAWKAHGAQWRPERELRAERPGVGQPGHVADAEVLWPSVPGSPRAGETWAVEVELTPKALARVQRIMSGLLGQQYSQVMYACAPAAAPVVQRAAASLGKDQAARLILRELPPAAAMPRAA